MTRRRWIYPKGGDPVEVDPEYKPEPKNGDAVMWNDRLYQDANDPRYLSRATHREYMKRNGLTTMDDFKGEWAGAEKKRQAAFQGIAPERKQQIAQAFDRLASRRK